MAPLMTSGPVSWEGGPGEQQVQGGRLCVVEGLQSGLLGPADLGRALQMH